MNFSAPIICGTGKGKLLGFPTLNLAMGEVPQMEEGVYVCFARLGEHGIRLPAIMHYGARPTLGAPPSCEVHILNHVISIPPQSLTMEIVDKIRDVKNFGRAKKLSQQLLADTNTARGMLCLSC